MDVKDWKHGSLYGYLLIKVFKHFNMKYKKGVSGTVKQMFTMNTLIKNKCVEAKVGTKSQMSELVEVHECLNGELEDMQVTMATKDSEITQLKKRMPQLSTKGSSASDDVKD